MRERERGERKRKGGDSDKMVRRGKGMRKDKGEKGKRKKF